MKKITAIISLCFVLASCEKEITVDLPAASEKLVVEGSIEQGQPPIVFLSRSQGYFEPTDVASLVGSYISGAQVMVNDGTQDVQLEEVCASFFPDSLLPLLGQLIGIDAGILVDFDYCIYTAPNGEIVGEIGKTYTLQVIEGTDTATAVTNILEPPILDSCWFELYTGEENNGFAYCLFSEPSPIGNAYRWFSKRISTYADGEQKDQNFIAPFGSTFDDRFIDGITFEIVYGRGDTPNANKPDDTGPEAGWYNKVDTIVVKFAAIDPEVNSFFRSYDTEIGSQGNPFAAPSNITSNVVGGLGVWAGYGFTLDTIYPAQ